MRNLKLTLSFDGNNYHGWQRQKDVATVQQTLEDALSTITGHGVTVYGCSRTDAGVHALAYTCNFRTSCKIPALRVPYALNAMIGGDICVADCEEMRDGFHSQFSATGKTYIYKVHNHYFCDPFSRNYSFHFPYKIDFERLRQAILHIVGTHDFYSFMAVGGKVKSTVRTVRDLSIKVDGDSLLFSISADGFLYNMVRIIVGTLLYVGIGKIAPHDIPGILEARDRTLAGITAQPQGLYLQQSHYEKHGNASEYA